MPRVNRDLQRRMAARRERDKRRVPSERSYRFAPSADAEAELANGAAAAQEAPKSQAATRAPAARPAGRTPARSTPRRYADYAAEYAYVLGDLRRITVVVGGLLVALIALWVVLPK